MWRKTKRRWLIAVHESSCGIRQSVPQKDGIMQTTHVETLESKNHKQLVLTNMPDVKADAGSPESISWGSCTIWKCPHAGAYQENRKKERKTKTPAIRNAKTAWWKHTLYRRLKHDSVWVENRKNLDSARIYGTLAQQKWERERERIHTATRITITRHSAA